MDKRDLLKEGLTWSLGNGNKINFWLDNWMNEILIKKVFLEKVGCIDKEAKVSKFIDMTKSWKLNNLKASLLDDTIDKINNIPISLSNFEEKII